MRVNYACNRTSRLRVVISERLGMRVELSERLIDVSQFRRAALELGTALCEALGSCACVVETSSEVADCRHDCERIGSQKLKRR